MSSSYDYDSKILSEICPIFTEQTISDSDKESLLYSLTPYEGEIMKSRDNYFTKVEQGNLYIDKLLDFEKKYFESKYGEGIYQYMKEKRKEFIDKDIQTKCEGISCTTVSKDKIPIETMIEDLKTEYETYKILKSKNIVENSKNLISNQKQIQEDILDLYGETSVNQRKIEYRHEELMKISYMNNLITILYYLVLIFVLIYFLLTEQLNLSNNWPIYILLFVFPLYIYPFIFRYIKKLFLYLSSKMEIHGPKNAFLNQKLDMDFLDKHDI